LIAPGARVGFENATRKSTGSILLNGDQVELAFIAWGRFRKPTTAGLNIGDCCAYALAKIYTNYLNGTSNHKKPILRKKGHNMIDFLFTLQPHTELETGKVIGNLSISTFSFFSFPSNRKAPVSCQP
jgi:hypothetical protein